MQIRMLHDRPYITLDSIDRKIIDELSINARLSYTELGKEVGLSRVAVQLRINALMEHGVIEQFTIAVNPDKAGLYIPAFFDVSVDPKHLDQVAEQLKSHIFITHLFQLTGSSKLHMHGQFEDMKEMEHYIRTKLYVLPGVLNVESQIIVNSYKNRMGIRPLIPDEERL
ncbi:Lrp/AsnC family transcriptional regulator [Paenibacillus beijingensis]|uniref:AsnC family transcriptional regulator n=1 Tax=Paenibacillus beijingensis TaxID=1126833 RepID=A0A0D5NGJ6_9BACL|nr:Lrp/AsnC family transcriptional regulator [Paenibacillus beijingensis]AJY74092.1 AsnC family transcriptional regulator [Paenibacillus beijingensis]